MRRSGVGFLRPGQARSRAGHHTRPDQREVFLCRFEWRHAALGAEDWRDVAVLDDVLQYLAGLARVDDPNTGASLTRCDVIASV